MKSLPIGTKRVNHGGYVQIKTAVGLRRWPFEHRVVWESVYGPIPAGHVVHHKNENRADNSIDNLETCASNGKHMLAHHREKSQDTMRKVGLAGKGRKKSAETRAKMSAYWTGRKKSPEHAAKVAAICRRNSENRRGTKLTPAQKAAIIEGRRKYFARIKMDWSTSVCDRCGKSFVFKRLRRFCCRSCCAIWLNTHR